MLQRRKLDRRADMIAEEARMFDCRMDGFENHN